MPTLDEMYMRDAQRRAEEDRKRQRARLAGVRVAEPANPERAAEVNRLSREVGQPPVVVEEQYDQLTQYRRVKAAREAAERFQGLGDWLGQRENAAVSQGDLDRLTEVAAARDELTRAYVDAAARRGVRARKADGVLDRLGAFFEQGLAYVEGGLATVGGALQEWSANNPLPWTSEENIRRGREQAENLRVRARAARNGSEVAGSTSWETVKASPTLGNIGSFVLEQGVSSIPGMVATALNPLAFGVSQAGNIGQNRAENDGRAFASLGDIGIAAPFAAATVGLEAVGLHGIFGATARTALGRVGQASATEALTEFMQGSLENVGGSAGTEQGFDITAMFDEAFAGLVAGGGMGATIRTSAEVAHSVRSNGRLRNLMQRSAESKTRQRDPVAFRELLDKLGVDAGDSIYIPAEKIAEFNQDYGNDEFWGQYREEIDEALMVGGDVAVPVSQAAAHLSGTPDWEALEGDVRTTPAAMSMNEVAEAEAEWETLRREASETIEKAEREARRKAAPGDKLRQSIRDRLMNAGMRPEEAAANAEVTAALFETEAANLGRELTGNEFDVVSVQRVLPELLASPEAADSIDLIINAMRGGGDPSIGVGQTLLEFIRDRGGINDPGGDLASMGLPKRLIRQYDPDQGTLGGISGAGDYGIDTTLRAAIEAGFFPELQGVEAEAGPSQLDTQALLDAIGQELAGEPVYAEVREDMMRAAGQELRDLLSSAGLDPDGLSDAEIRGFVSSMDGREFAQGGTTPQGSIQFRDAQAVIRLFESANASTFQHEIAHFWLERFKANAEAATDTDGNEAARQTFADFETLKAWFKSEGYEIAEDGTIPEGAHELFARSWERYLLEGKSPSLSLQSVFRKFARWLKAVYSSVLKLNAPITPEVREVMDRMLATQAQIDEARQAQEAALMFDDAVEAGMSEADAKRYAALGEEARSAAEEELYGKVFRSIRAREQKQYREQEKTVRAEITEEVDARPMFKALAMLREQGGMRLDKTWLRETYGEDVLSLLPAGIPVWRDGGGNADQIAEMAGFKSGDELVRTLIGMEATRKQMREGGDKRSVRARTIDEAVAREMNERFGDPLSDGSIEREAQAAVMNERNGERIEMELRALGSKTNRRPTPLALARRWAKEKIERGIVAETISGAAQYRYARTATKAARDALKAYGAGNNEDAFRLKQVEMLHNALAREAAEASERIEKAVKRMGDLAKQRTVKSIDQDYLDRIHGLLENYEFKRVSQRKIDARDAYARWAQEQVEAGHDVVAVERLAQKQNWSRMTVEEITALDDAVKQLRHLGRLKQTLLDNKERRDFEEIRGEAIGQMAMLHQKPKKGWFGGETRLDWIKSGVASLNAVLIKQEEVFDHLDADDPNGVFNRIVFRPLADAQAREREMLDDIMGRLLDAMKGLPRETHRRWQERHFIPELPDLNTGEPSTFLGTELVGMALNMGNRGNMEKLIGGFGWDKTLGGMEAARAKVMEVLNRELSPEEWGYVQYVWDTINELWPEIEAMERRVNGVAPDKVEAMPVETNAGTLSGGYFPAIYDPRSKIGDRNLDVENNGLFASSYTRATSRAGSTHERTEFKGPLHLDLGVINRHVAEVVHDITHREVIINADKLLGDDRIRAAAESVLGPEVVKQWRPWLQHVANEWATDREGNSKAERFLKATRTNATVVGLGFRVSTMMLQISGYSNSIERVGIRWVARGVRKMLTPGGYGFAMAHSKELGSRMATMDRDIRDNARRLASKNGNLLDNVQRFAFHGIGYMDRVVSVGTWLGAYDKAMAEGLSEEVAIYEADKAVRQSQGSGAAKDLARVQRGSGKGGEAWKLLTMFYSFASALYQRQYRLYRDTGQAVRERDAAFIPEFAARFLFLVIIPALVSEWLAGRGPEEDEDEAAWAMGKIATYMLLPIPFARDIGSAVESGFGYSYTPAEGFGRSVVNVVNDIDRAVFEGEDTKRATRNFLEMTGYVTGKVPGQVAATTQFLVDVGYGEQDPETAAEWWEGLTKGKIAE